LRLFPASPASGVGEGHLGHVPEPRAERGLADAGDPAPRVEHEHPARAGEVLDQARVHAQQRARLAALVRQVDHPQPALLRRGDPGRHEHAAHAGGEREQAGAVLVDLGQQLLVADRAELDQAREGADQRLGLRPDDHRVGRAAPALVARVDEQLADLAEGRGRGLDGRRLRVVGQQAAQVRDVEVGDDQAARRCLSHGPVRERGSRSGRRVR
jgi:hypothetical protein